MTAHTSRHITTTINASALEVYTFARHPDNLPKWASGLASSKAEEQDGDTLVVQSPMGKIKVEFVPQNEFGVLDHRVRLPSGQVVYNPLRVMPNGEGSEVVFTLYRLAGTTDADFAADAENITADLATLKKLLEK